jgi:hypothetical protein
MKKSVIFYIIILILFQLNCSTKSNFADSCINECSNYDVLGLTRFNKSNCAHRYNRLVNYRNNKFDSCKNDKKCIQEISNDLLERSSSLCPRATMRLK